jgi:hypothetical protein
MMGTEIEVDNAICDGEVSLSPASWSTLSARVCISGDSIRRVSAWNLNGPLIERIIEHSKQLALSLHTPRGCSTFSM